MVKSTKEKEEVQQNGFSGKRGTMLRLSLTLDRRIQNQEMSSEVSAGAGPRPRWEKCAFPQTRFFFEVTERGFLEICSTKIVKSSVFHGQETRFEERSSPTSLLPRPEANKSGSHKLQIVNSCLTNGRMTFWSVQVLEPHDLRRMETNKMGQKELQQHRAILGGMRIRAAGSKILLFLFKYNSFCAAGESGTS